MYEVNLQWGSQRPRSYFLEKSNTIFDNGDPFANGKMGWPLASVE
jgi:hypothetical protein